MERVAGRTPHVWIYGPRSYMPAVLRLCVTFGPEIRRNSRVRSKGRYPMRIISFYHPPSTPRHVVPLLRLQATRPMELALMRTRSGLKALSLNTSRKAWRRQTFAAFGRMPRPDRARPRMVPRPTAPQTKTQPCGAASAGKQRKTRKRSPC